MKDFEVAHFTKYDAKTEIPLREKRRQNLYFRFLELEICDGDPD